MFVVRPVPRRDPATVPDRAARIGPFIARHLLLLVLTSVALLIAAGLVARSHRVGLLAAEALLVDLYIVMMSLSFPVTRFRRGPKMPLDAQIALRRMRNRGYHPRDHRLLWHALDPCSAGPDR